MRTHCGHVSDMFPAPVVFPATREVMEGYKTVSLIIKKSFRQKLINLFQYGTATGSCGTISWQVEGLKLRLIVMWSVPFNLAIHKSYLAIGI